MEISKFKDIRCLVIRPAKDGAIVTKKDQKALGQIFTWSGKKFTLLHFHVKERENVIARVKSARLSKEMIVTEITDAQLGHRFKGAETIPWTGIWATRKQLADSFTIGMAVGGMTRNRGNGEKNKYPLATLPKV